MHLYMKVHKSINSRVNSSQLYEHVYTYDKEKMGKAIITSW